MGPVSRTRFPPTVCTIKCVGVLVDSTSVEIAEHIGQSWANGQVAVSMLRDELAPSADVHVPLTNGGVLLHKLQGVMHDTCHTANKLRAYLWYWPNPTLYPCPNPNDSP